MMNRTMGMALGVLVVVLVGLLVFRESQLAGQAPKEGIEVSKDKDPRKIQTSGSATLRVKPNRARLFLAVETTFPTVKQARAVNKQAVENVITAIQGLRIADLKMKSTNVEMDVVHSKPEKQDILPVILGYRVTYTFTVLVAGEDTEKLASAAAKVLDTALENGANTLQQIVFFRDDLTEIRRQTLTKATEDAVANAQALAAGAKRTVADILNIDSNPEHSFTAVHNPMSNSILAQPAPGNSTELVAGDVEVTCRVSVTATFGAAK
jgi:uncharacterized protein